MSARQRILGRLRAAATSRLPQAVAPTSSRIDTASPDECVARFAAEAAALGVDCHIEMAPADVRARLLELVTGHSVLSWDPTSLPYGVGEMLEHPLHGDAPLALQAAAEFGVTACDAAVAETASLVLFSAPGRSRTVSLLPPVHVAIVERSKLCLSLGDVFERYRDRVQDAASCTIITGPSRTADIELTLTLGIHGPGRVIVILGP
jgi:L-lactate dehydrogenase complex protein LldG